MKYFRRTTDCTFLVSNLGELHCFDLGLIKHAIQLYTYSEQEMMFSNIRGFVTALSVVRRNMAHHFLPEIWLPSLTVAV